MSPVERCAMASGSFADDDEKQKLTVVGGADVQATLERLECWPVRRQAIHCDGLGPPLRS